MMNIIDFHTHRQNATDAIISVNPWQFDPQPGLRYSVGFHPWYNVDTLTDNDFTQLEHCARHEQVLAIGETGMDSLKGAALDIQAKVFERHLHIAATVAKPVVVHSVRTAQNILTVRRHAGLTSITLAIHGMRANAHVAQTLLDAGCYLSYGIRFNPDALSSTPLDRLLIETDDSDATIDEVATQVAQVLHLTPNEVKSISAANTATLLRLHHSPANK